MWPFTDNTVHAQKASISPAYLRNDNNKYLNYTDDWYILAQKPDEYVVIYYRGNNDAWKGYGGATIYTRCAADGLKLCVHSGVRKAEICDRISQWQVQSLAQARLS